MNERNLKYDTVYITLDGTIMKNSIVDTQLMKFIFQCINNKVRIVLFSKRLEDEETEFIQEHKIEPLFNEFYRVTDEENLSPYIKHKNSIFIDNSLFRRNEIHRKHKIPTFDAKMVEMLID